ncbi:MAG: tyrosine-type recombinase/integrase [Chloroflexi bacterium]|nr:tyrosine-type recombinase/integrase [Chloroflexota bacterium]
MTERRRLPGEGTIGTRIRKRTDGSEYIQHFAALGSGRSRVWVYGKTPAEVAKRLADLRKRRDEGQTTLKNIPRLDTFLEGWLEYVVRPSATYNTYAFYRQQSRNHIIPALGRRRVDRLTVAEVQAFLGSRLAAGLAPQTVRHIRATLRAALNVAMRWRLVTHNAAALATPPRVPYRERARLTPDQSRALLAAVRTHRLGALFTLALATGARQGQLLGLRWQDIDFENGVLHLRQALHHRDGQYLLDAPKTRGSRAAVPLPAPLASVLRDHERQESEDSCQPPGEAWEAELVFRTERGRPLAGHLVTTQFQRVLKVAGLPRMTFHDLRGSCATLLAVLGVHPRVAMEILGHADFTTTMQYYTEVIGDERRVALEGLAGLLWRDDVGRDVGPANNGTDGTAILGTK